MNLSAGKPQRTTLADVAKKASVSVSTVSAVLGDRPHCFASEATRGAVRQAARELGYRPNLLARSLRSESTKTIGVLVPLLDRGVVAGGKLQSIEDAATAHGYRLIVSAYKGDVSRLQQAVDELLGRHVDGIVFWGVDGRHTAVVKEAMHAPVNVVTLEAEAQFDVPDLTVDRMQGTYLTMRHLLDLGRRPALLYTGHACLSGQRKVEGVKRAAAEHDYDLDAAVILQEASPVSTSTAIGVAMARELLTCRERYDAVLTFSDDVAAGVIATLASAGVDVPNDVAVAGFDGSYAPEAMVIPITTVAQPRDLGGPLFDLLKIDRTDSGSTHDQGVVLTPSLYIRESTVAGAGVGGPVEQA